MSSIKMRDFFELLFDKRFSLRFRILNILSGDILRNYLAVGVLTSIRNCEKVLNDSTLPDYYRINAAQRYVEKAHKSVNDIWQI